MAAETPEGDLGLHASDEHTVLEVCTHDVISDKVNEYLVYMLVTIFL